MLKRLTFEGRAPASVCVRETLRQRQWALPDLPPRVTVGRSPNNDVLLSSETIPCLLSREHAYLLLAPDGRLLVVDKDTTNGTYVNDRKLPRGGRRALQDDDIVSFGGPGMIMVAGRAINNPFRYRFKEDPAFMALHDALVVHDTTLGPAAAEILAAKTKAVAAQVGELLHAAAKKGATADEGSPLASPRMAAAAAKLASFAAEEEADAAAAARDQSAKARPFERGACMAQGLMRTAPASACPSPPEAAGGSPRGQAEPTSSGSSSGSQSDSPLGRGRKRPYRDAVAFGPVEASPNEATSPPRAGSGAGSGPGSDAGARRGSGGAAEPAAGSGRLSPNEAAEAGHRSSGESSPPKLNSPRGEPLGSSSGGPGSVSPSQRSSGEAGDAAGPVEGPGAGPRPQSETSSGEPPAGLESEPTGAAPLAIRTSAREGGPAADLATEPASGPPAGAAGDDGHSSGPDAEPGPSGAVADARADALPSPRPAGTSEPSREVPAWFLEGAAEEWQCSVCRDWMVAAHGLPCSHTFCGSCLFDWLAKKSSCPVCRHAVLNPPVPIRSTDKMITRMVEHTMSEEALADRGRRRAEWEERARALASRDAAAAAAATPPPPPPPPAAAAPPPAAAAATGAAGGLPAPLGPTLALMHRLMTQLSDIHSGNALATLGPGAGLDDPDAAAAGGSGGSSGAGGSGSAGPSAPPAPGRPIFSIEYNCSQRSRCRTCYEAIPPDVLRVGVSQRRARLADEPPGTLTPMLVSHHHAACISASLREQIRAAGGARALFGYLLLRAEDQARITAQLMQ